MVSTQTSLDMMYAAPDGEPVFSLICLTCDAGDDMETEEQAIAAGWCDIVLALSLPQANYCGLCSDCRKRQEITT